MSTTLRHPRGLAWIAVLLLGFGLSGCGGGRGYGYGYGGGYYGGTLEVRNDFLSFEGIDYVHLWVPGGPVESFPVFLLPGERDIIELYPDTYTVEFEWSDAAVDTYPFVDIYDGGVTVLVGLN